MFYNYLLIMTLCDDAKEANFVEVGKLGIGFCLTRKPRFSV